MFSMFDKLGTGRICKNDLSAISELASNPLADRILSIISQKSQDDEEYIVFDDILHFLSLLSVNASKCSKLYFTFKMYDMDGDGKLSNRDVFHALTIMVGGNLTPIQLQQIVDKAFIVADVDRDGYISYH
uniref:Calcineurin subunit B n=1 Tax=Lygus hesperus TaxID=30085 RepID=A0A0A9YKK4_LYGHE